MNPSDPLAVRLSCAEAAKLIGVPVRTLERWRCDRRGPKYFHPPGTRPFYLKSDVTDWLDAFPVATYPALARRSPR